MNTFFKIILIVAMECMAIPIAIFILYLIPVLLEQELDMLPAVINTVLKVGFTGFLVLFAVVIVWLPIVIINDDSTNL